MFGTGVMPFNLSHRFMGHLGLKVCSRAFESKVGLQTGVDSDIGVCRAGLSGVCRILEVFTFESQTLAVYSKANSNEQLVGK